jgi:hypothetical protein
MNEYLKHATGEIYRLIEANDGTSITAKTEILLSIGGFGNVTRFTAEHFVRYISVLDPKHHAKAKAGAVLAAYVRSKQEQYVNEACLYVSEKWEKVEDPIFSRINDLIALPVDTPNRAIKIKQAAMCAVLAIELADISGCFTGLIYLRVPSLEQIKSEYPLCKGAADNAYSKFLESTEEFYVKAFELVETVQNAEIAAMAAYFPNMHSIPISDDLRKFLKRYRVLCRYIPDKMANVNSAETIIYRMDSLIDKLKK